MKDLNFIGLSHKHAAIGAMGHNHHRTVLIARPRILLLKHHRELHRNIGIVVEILIESRAVVVESLNEVGTNVVAQFAIFGEAVVLILISPRALGNAIIRLIGIVVLIAGLGLILFDVFSNRNEVKADVVEVKDETPPENYDGDAAVDTSENDGDL